MATTAIDTLPNLVGMVQILPKESYCYTYSHRIGPALRQLLK